MKQFETYKDALKECIENTDSEEAHIRADGILIKIALEMDLTLEEKTELIELYNEVHKWYA